MPERCYVLTKNCSSTSIEAPASNVFSSSCCVSSRPHGEEHHSNLVLVARHELLPVSSLCYACKAVAPCVHVIHPLYIL